MRILKSVNFTPVVLKYCPHANVYFDIESNILPCDLMIFRWQLKERDRNDFVIKYTCICAISCYTCAMCCRFQSWHNNIMMKGHSFCDITSVDNTVFTQSHTQLEYDYIVCYRCHYKDQMGRY